MFNLPIDIQRIIYEYDSTYRNKFRLVLKKIEMMNGRFIKGITHGYPLTLKYYSEDWHKKSCITQGHKIKFHKPYAVLGICQCGITQIYFYKG